MNYSLSCIYCVFLYNQRSGNGDVCVAVKSLRYSCLKTSASVRARMYIPDIKSLIGNSVGMVKRGLIWMHTDHGCRE